MDAAGISDPALTISLRGQRIDHGGSIAFGPTVDFLPRSRDDAVPSPWRRGVLRIQRYVVVVGRRGPWLVTAALSGPNTVLLPGAALGRERTIAVVIGERGSAGAAAPDHHKGFDLAVNIRHVQYRALVVPSQCHQAYAVTLGQQGMNGCPTVAIRSAVVGDHSAHALSRSRDLVAVSRPRHTQTRNQMPGLTYSRRRSEILASLRACAFSAATCGVARTAQACCCGAPDWARRPIAAQRDGSVARPRAGKDSHDGRCPRR